MSNTAPMKLINESGEVLGKFEMGSITPAPNPKTMEKIETDLQGEFIQAVVQGLKKLGPNPSRGQVIDVVDGAWSTANITSKMISVMVPDLTQQIHNLLLPLAENIANEMCHSDELLQSFQQYSAARRTEVATVMHQRITEGTL